MRVEGSAGTRGATTTNPQGVMPTQDCAPSFTAPSFSAQFYGAQFQAPSFTAPSFRRPGLERALDPAWVRGLLTAPERAVKRVPGGR